MSFPENKPVTIPAGDTEALPLLLLHTPPAVASLRFVVNPLQIPLAPVMVTGTGFMFTTIVIKHPVGTV